MVWHTPYMSLEELQVISWPLIKRMNRASTRVGEQTCECSGELVDDRFSRPPER